MRAVLQRVKNAEVVIDGESVGKIGTGFLVLLGISQEDSEKDCDYLCSKIPALRVFEDKEGKMNLSLEETGGELLVVSQFTLYADCRKGRRPSFVQAARPEKAVPLYERFVKTLSEQVKVQTGQFGADMQVTLQNDGPVTILLDTEELLS